MIIADICQATVFEAACGTVLVQVREAGSELYRAGALQWELARLCSALALALEGNQLPLATGRPSLHQCRR